MTEPEIETDPEHGPTVRLLARDFEMLQTAVAAVTEDVAALATLLGVTPPDGVAPQIVMRELLLPRVAALVAVSQRVDEANAMITQGAARFGPPTVEGGRTVQKVGQRIPGLLEVPRLSRSERRRLEREARR